MRYTKMNRLCINPLTHKRVLTLTMLGDKIRDTSCSNEKYVILLFNTQLYAANGT